MAMISGVRPLARRLLVLAGALFGVALALDVVVPSPLAPSGDAAAVMWFVALLAAFCVVEMQPLHMEWAGQTYSLSLSEVPLVVGLLCFWSPLLILARVLGSGLALALHRKQSPVKLGFNLAVQFLEASVAMAVFGALPQHASKQTLSAAPAVVLAVLIASGLSMSAVCAAIRWTVGQYDRAVVWSFASTGLAAIVVNSSIALVGVAAVRDDYLLTIPLVVVAVAVGATYRAYATLRHRHSNLGLLYDFTRGLGDAGSDDTRIGQLLERTAQMMHADEAGLLLFASAEGESPLLRRARVGRKPTTEVYLPQCADWPFSRLLEHGTGLVIPRTTRDLGLISFLQGRGFRDAVLAPLQLDGVVRGVLFVADHVGDVTTFTREDGALLETMAAQVSNVLDNSRLLDQLTYESMHDALTGLVNRQCYQTRLRAALVTAPTPCAVLLADLDRFKEVNDTLGHHHGDLLIREIARRVEAAAPAHATVARLGGDEFALVVAGADTAEAIELGHRILATVGRPCLVDGIRVDVDASIGIAVSPEHGSDDSVLLKRADMAMYAAKAAGTGVEVYDALRDEYSPRRLALASQLRQAIERDELTLHYQPQVRSCGGRAASVEALVRWSHPDYGYVPPAEFIPLAEQSGVIADLTGWVLSTALRQAAAWRADGIEVGVSVNISMRNLLDASVPETIDRLLRKHDLPHGVLTLEITESHLMSDPTRTLPVLHRLSSLGARISVDDFGTGYSSLAYLQQIPVDEIKIDKTFVQGVANGPNDASIVRAIVGLGESLGLETVAEGVEDEETAVAMLAMGCTRLQGFHIGRPVPAAEVRLTPSDPSRFGPSSQNGGMQNGAMQRHGPPIAV
jgi:diguanylate cyclase (GGDEF)-like protein